MKEFGCGSLPAAGQEVLVNGKVLDLFIADAKNSDKKQMHEINNLVASYL